MRTCHSGRPEGRGVSAAVVPAVCLVLGLALLAASRSCPPARAAQAPEEPQAPATGSEVDLNRKYRFIERYGAEAEKGTPGVIGSYQVAFRETIETTTEVPRTAPRRERVTHQAKYSERPAEVSDFEGHPVISLVRRYHSVRSRPDRRARSTDPFPLDDLTIWFQTRSAEPPLIVELTGERRLREEEYRFAAFEQIFVPDLAGLLPGLPTRIGDSWQVARAGAQTLVGGLIGGGGLIGTLVEVREDPKTGQAMASITISGHVLMTDAETAVNARVRFAFVPASPPAGDTPTSTVRDDGTIDAPGAIVQLSLAQVETDRSSRASDRSRGTRRRELVLERRLGDADDSPLPLLKTPPVPTPENSWLTRVDPRLRFHFRYPQELLPEPAPEPGVILLVRRRPEGSDLVRLELTAEAVPRPDDVARRKAQEWATLGLEVVPGTSRWLPEADWPGKRVYRFEAALKPGARGSRGAGRVHFDGYVIQFGRNTSLYLEGMTAQDPPTPFRMQVEDLLKTFTLGPPPPR